MNTLIFFLQSLNPIFLSLFSFVFIYGFVLLVGCMFGKNGLYVVVPILIIAANIQVLKVTQYNFFSSPVALGTEMFAALYLCTDILSELYGKKSAQTAVIFGFIAMLFWAIFSILTLGFAPISLTEANGDTWLYEMHNHMQYILRPSLAILVASLCAFLISQFVDIYIFTYIRGKTGKKFLWLRNNLSTIISALIDNTVFSILAWILLSQHPLPVMTVIKTYILGTYIFRIIAALLDTPVMYLAKKFIVDNGTFTKKIRE